jgi:hypothetical protein
MGLLLALLAGLRWLTQPERLAPALLDALGNALGLDITASGVGEYRLRGTPQLIVRGVVAREPGAGNALLSAERILISVPWSTLRSRGQDLTITRLELDAPILDVAALQAWLGRRPPGDGRMPRLTDGLQVSRGSVLGDGWSVRGLDASLARLVEDQPVRAQLSGRMESGEVKGAFDLALTLLRPALPSALGLAGQVSARGEDWRLPARVRLAGKLHRDPELRMEQIRLGASGRYQATASETELATGLAGSLAWTAGHWLAAPLALALRGQDAIPTLDAHGQLQLGHALSVDLQGQLAQWPQAWPALPPPLGQSQAALPLVLGYDGKPDLSGVARLQLQRDDSRVTARFRLSELLAWTQQGAHGSPLPPLSGQLHAPRLEVSGAVLEGVQVQMDDPTLPDETPSP